MPTVELRREGISADEVADVVRRGLGAGYQVHADGGAEVLVRRGTSRRARVSLRACPGATVADVRGQGLPVPVLVLSLKLLNDRGIAKLVANILRSSEELGGVR